VTQLIVLYRMPKDPERFDKYYREVHGPMTSKLPGLKATSMGLPVRWTAAPANSSGIGPAHSTAVRLPSMPLPRRKAKRALPTCQTTIMMFRSSCSSKIKPPCWPRCLAGCREHQAKARRQSTTMRL
jgi:hypothetical protein